MKSLIWILNLYLILQTNADDFNIIEINNTGILFEETNPTILYQNQWQIFTTIKLPDISENLNYLRYYIKETTNLCNQIKNKTNKTPCAYMNLALIHKEEEIEIKNAELEKIFSESRTKRSLMNIGGRGLKFLFGTMDDTDETNIYKRLEILERDDEATLNLMKEQVSVIKSNYNRLEKPISTLINETQLFRDRINKIEVLLRITNELTALKQEMLELTSFILIKIINIQETQNTAFSIINSLKMHKIHPLVITQNDLKQIVNKINEACKINTIFLNLHHLEQIIEISHYESSEGIIIKIQIPIPTEDVYTTNKIHLLPIHLNNGSCVMLRDTADYILSNEKKIQYNFYDQSEYSLCREVIINFETRINVCKAIKPILTNGDHCLIRLLHNPFEQKTNCNLKPVLYSTDILTPLSHSNAWLFIVENEQKILITCGEMENRISIKGQKVIKFNSFCKIKTKDYIIPIQGMSSETITIKQPLSYSSEFAPTFQTQKMNFSEDTSLIVTSYLPNQFLDKNEDLEMLERHIKSEETRRNKIKTDSNIVYHGISWTTLIIISIVIIALFCYFRKPNRNYIQTTPIAIGPRINEIELNSLAPNKANFPTLKTKEKTGKPKK